MSYESWGRWIPSTPARVVHNLRDTTDLVLPYGLGRSYGDSCLNNGHALLDTRELDHFRAFDDATGVLDCEGGMTLAEILRVFVPRGWFLPVTPGTKFVTVGGCIANDVHGKNHHRAGTFGRHVRSLELVRSDGSRTRCAPGDPMFAATIGGLGLTGLIASAEIQLRRIESAEITVERVPFRSLDEFEALSKACDATHEYTVAWFDSFSGAKGIFFQGNHAPLTLPARQPRGEGARRLPILPVLNQLTVRAFNTAYFVANARPKPQRVHWNPFFYPLDAVANWNAIYGRNGFLQYQFVIPEIAGLDPVKEIVNGAARSKLASFLTVIKKFGALSSPGLLSFPRAGTTVCFDFAARGLETLLPMLERFDDVVEAAGGRVYPAKDARMSGPRFRRFFPQWEELRKYADPQFSSSFWRRVMS
ncbi:MAG TPA: FAD-binding oxidoreductase [Thermoanaerobaculia bacterium]|nr:FAD-binding oxidoreductase [Thermoanaerobaculia bacterium]